MAGCAAAAGCTYIYIYVYKTNFKKMPTTKMVLLAGEGGPRGEDVILQFLYIFQYTIYCTATGGVCKIPPPLLVVTHNFPSRINNI